MDYPTPKEQEQVTDDDLLLDTIDPGEDQEPLPVDEAFLAFQIDGQRVRFNDHFVVEFME